MRTSRREPGGDNDNYKGLGPKKVAAGMLAGVALTGCFGGTQTDPGKTPVQPTTASAMPSERPTPASSPTPSQTETANATVGEVADNNIDTIQIPEAILSSLSTLASLEEEKGLYDAQNASKLLDKGIADIYNNSNAIPVGMRDYFRATNDMPTFEVSRHPYVNGTPSARPIAERVALELWIYATLRDQQENQGDGNVDPFVRALERRLFSMDDSKVFWGLIGETAPKNITVKATATRADSADSLNMNHGENGLYVTWGTPAELEISLSNGAVIYVENYSAFSYQHKSVGWTQFPIDPRLVRNTTTGGVTTIGASRSKVPKEIQHRFERKGA